MKRSSLVGAMLAALLATTAAAQEAPAVSGPYLWVQADTDHVVMVATGTRHRTALGWAATGVTVFDLDGVGQVRVLSVIEADCDSQVRRTAELHVYPAPDIDAPLPRTGVVPGVPWGGLGPNDGPVMAFLCEGQADSARIKAKVSQHVSAWRATNAGAW